MIDTIETKGPKELLRHISLQHKRYRGYTSEFIFRGQADSIWSIIPRALRKNEKLPTETGLQHAPLSTNRNQIEAEIYIIHRFCEELNKNGIYIPSEDILYNSLVNNSLVTKLGRSEIMWPPRPYHSTIALAQHYGLPTRFVDWTYSPCIAAYFAAKESIRLSQMGRKIEYLSVYALDVSMSFRSALFEKDYEHQRDFSREEDWCYQLIYAPAFFNDNLKAQRSVFLAYIQKKFNPNGTCTAHSVENYVDEKNGLLKNLKMYKFIMPQKGALELLRLMSKEEYIASRIFPSIPGCVESIYERYDLFD